MNYNQLIQYLSQQSGCAQDLTKASADAITKWITNKTIDAGKLLIPDFGQFEIVKHDEYILVDKTSHKRYLMPPRLSIRFLPYQLMERMADEGAQQTGTGFFSSIADMLVRHCGVDNYQADKLSVGFFKCILEGMDGGEPVALDNLGTFLLSKVKVESRIYGNVVFTPDETFSAGVNRPFDFFEQEELNDGVHFDDIKTFDSYDIPSDKEKEVMSFVISDEDSNESDESDESDVTHEVQSIEVETQESQNVEDSDTGHSTETKESQASSEPSRDGMLQTLSEPEEKQPISNVLDEGQGIREEEEHEETAAPRNHLLRYLLLAVAGILLLGGIVYFMSGQGQQTGEEVMALDSLPTQTTENVTAEVEDSLPVVTEKAKDTLDYRAMNAQIPYGAYDIVGVDTTIIVRKGQTLSDISRVFLGTDIQIYLIVLNNGNDNPQEGEKYKIPKLKMRR